MAAPSRRTVLRTGVLLAAASAPLGVAQHALSVVPGAAASGLRRSSFTPHVRSRFYLVDEGGESYAATLTKVADLTAAPRGHDAKFRLLFRMKGARPAAGIYRLRHHSVAATDLFMTPVGKKGDVYEVVVDAR